MPIHTILALTDFSIQAEQALDRAALLAVTHQARLRIVYASDTPPLQLAGLENSPHSKHTAIEGGHWVVTQNPGPVAEAALAWVTENEVTA